MIPREIRADRVNVEGSCSVDTNSRAKLGLVLNTVPVRGIKNQSPYEPHQTYLKDD